MSVFSDERLDRGRTSGTGKSRNECGVHTREQDDQNHGDKSEPGEVRLEGALVDQSYTPVSGWLTLAIGTTIRLTVTADALVFHGVEEPEIRDLDNHPADQTGHGGDVDHPAKSDRCIVGQGHVDQGHQGQRGGNRDPWSSEAVDSGKDPGCLACLGQTIQGAAAEKNAGRSAAKGRGDDDGVDDGRQGFDP